MFKNFTQPARKTRKGIIINQRCGDTVKACYYRDGNYPAVPQDPKKPINEWSTEEDLWHEELKGYAPDRVHEWMD